MKVKSICRRCGKTSMQYRSVKGRVQTCPHCQVSQTFLFDAMEAPRSATRAPRKKSAPKSRRKKSPIIPTKKEETQKDVT